MVLGIMAEIRGFRARCGCWSRTGLDPEVLRKRNPSSRVEIYWGNIGVILGLYGEYWDNGKENGNYYNTIGFRGNLTVANYHRACKREQRNSVEILPWSGVLLGTST